MKKLILYLYTSLFITPAFGQQNFPSSTQTFGDFKNIYTGIKHPSLSLNGFIENQEKGNSLQEIITNLNTYQTQILSFDNDFGSSLSAKDPNIDPGNKILTVQSNSISLEKQAFMALLTFGLEKYQNNANHGFTRFQFTANLLKENLKKQHNWYVVNREIQGNKPDYVKWTC